MNISEKRSELIMRISTLDDRQFETLYNEMLAILQSGKPYQLTDEESHAIDQALDGDESERLISKQQVLAESRVKYPNLKFK
jgi:hypothetical protein